MKVKVIVNNYNYENYVGCCLESLESQTRIPDEVIFIDDGSTDSSVEVAETFLKSHINLKIVKKSNGGQLSALNKSTQYVDDNDLVILMDSDDIYPLDYISEVLQKINPYVHVFFAAATEYETVPPVSALTGKISSSFYKKSQAVTRLYRSAWIGNVTSSIVIKGAALKKILPYPEEKDWITRADDVIVFGSSLLGMSKQIENTIAIGYRQHGSNLFARKKRTRQQKKMHDASKEKLIRYYCELAGISRRPPLGEVINELREMPCQDMKKYRIPRIIRLLAKFIGSCRVK